MRVRTIDLMFGGWTAASSDTSFFFSARMVRWYRTWDVGGPTGIWAIF